MLSRLLAASLPLVPRPIVRRVARRYVAGSGLLDALAETAKLNEEGCSATVALLGEEVREEAEIETAVAEYLRLLAALAERDLDAGVSVKPTHVGLVYDRSLCAANLRRLVEAAAAVGRFVRIDMEDHTTTTATLEIFRQLHREHDNVGIVLQAYLKRTLDDVHELPEGADARLCKGIYVEPATVAYQDHEAIRSSFLEALEALLERELSIAIATHDEYLIDRASDLLAARSVTRDRYEFQMLLGVLPTLRRKLVERGERVRVYVPYGPDWYDYSLRRLRENPQIALHVLRALVGRG